MAELFYAGAGELATVSNTFTVSGTPTDPTTISLVITDPTGTATTYTYAAAQITRTGTGVYTKDIPCSAAGVWTYVWIGTGAASDVTAGTWTVQSTSLGQLYCTPERLKSRVNTTKADRDAEVLGALLAVSRWIEDRCDRVFYRVTETRTYSASTLHKVSIHDLVSVTSIATDTAEDGTYTTTWSPTDYQLLKGAVLRPAERPYTAIKAVGAHTFPLDRPTGRQALVQVHGVFGWPAVPSPVQEAAAIWATDLLKLGTMAFGIAGYGEYGAVRARPNPIVEALLAPYQRHPVQVA